MKKYTSILLALFVSGVFLGCSSSNDTETKEEIETNTSTASKEETTSAVQTEEQIMPQCYIAEGTPKTDSSVVVHVKCRNGNIPIDEARVIVDGKTKSVDYVQADINDYIGFQNLQPDTLYKAQLEVIVDGETISKNVKIRTNKEVVKATPTPTPTPNPIVDTPPSYVTPQWTKSFYDTDILITDDEKNNFIINLRSICIVEPMQDLSFSIEKIALVGYGDNENITYNGMLKIENGILLFAGYHMGTGSRDSVIVTIRATSHGKSNDTQVKFDYLLPTM